MNVIGKPYSGKPNVRFDEGAVETDPPEADTAPLLYSTQRKLLLKKES